MKWLICKLELSFWHNNFFIREILDNHIIKLCWRQIKTALNTHLSGTISKAKQKHAEFSRNKIIILTSAQKKQRCLQCKMCQPMGIIIITVIASCMISCNLNMFQLRYMDYCVTAVGGFFNILIFGMEENFCSSCHKFLRETIKTYNQNSLSFVNNSTLFSLYCFY